MFHGVTDSQVDPAGGLGLIGCSSGHAVTDSEIREKGGC